MKKSVSGNKSKIEVKKEGGGGREVEEEVIRTTDGNGETMSRIDSSFSSLTVSLSVSPLMEMAVLSEVSRISSGGGSGGGEVTNIPISFLSYWTNNFSLERKLGEGGFGEVFLGVALNVTEGIEVRFAIKRVSPLLQMASTSSSSSSSMSSSKALSISSSVEQMRETVLSVRREINVLKSFRHPNIIKLLGYSIPSDVSNLQQQQLCLVYELAPRGGLDKHLLDDALARELTWGRRVRILYGIACALNCFHSRDEGTALHRDVKSANIALMLNYLAKLIDCGLSKLVPKDAASSALLMTVQTGVNQMFGTRGYQVRFLVLLLFSFIFIIFIFIPFLIK